MRGDCFFMKEWCVIYSSLTGNTKLVAEAMAEEADADIFSVAEAPEDLSGYEAVALGYWLRLGAPDPKMLALLPKIEGKDVVFFQTHGTDPGSEHAVTAFARAGYALGADCYIAGTFSCQGKLNPKIVEKRKKEAAAEDDPHAGKKAQARWQRAASHPDAEDLQRAHDFMRVMLEKRLKRKARLEAGKM